MQAANGTMKRVVPFRLAPGEDVYKSLEAICEKEGIQYGVMLTCIGSLKAVRYCVPVPLPDTKAGMGYGDPIEDEGMLELLSCSGIVGRDHEGKPNLHLHYSFSNQDGSVYGGHMIEGVKVLITVEGAIGVFEDVALTRRLEPDLDVYVLDPHEI